MPVGDRSYGARHDRAGRHADLPRIAEMIRADIAFARTFSVFGSPTEVALRSPIRDAPEGISYSVETPSFGRIVITVEGVPPGWGRATEDESVSPELQALADELAEIMNSYNRDGSDVGKRFFGSVRIGDVTLVW